MIWNFLLVWLAVQIPIGLLFGWYFKRRDTMNLLNRLRRALKRKTETPRIVGQGLGRIFLTSDKDNGVYEQLVRHGLIDPGDNRQAGIKPPTDEAADGWTWDAWSSEMRSLAFPGWSPCRFAHRSTPQAGTDNARFVFGLTNGPFGIWQQTFDVCAVNDGEWDREQEILSCLTHLPTGMGLGIFRHRDGAALAADTAMRTCSNWPDLIEYGTPSWIETINRTCHAWGMLGIIPSSNAHAHDPNTQAGPLLIMGLADNIETNRPEKLS